MRELGRAPFRFAARSGGEQHEAHRCALADAIGRHVAGDELHRVVNRQPGGHAAAGRVQIQVNVRLRIVGLQKQHLGDDRIGDVVVDRGTEEDDPVLEQATVNVHRPLFAAVLLDHIRNQRHGVMLEVDLWGGMPAALRGHEMHIPRSCPLGAVGMAPCYFSSSSSSACIGGRRRMSSTKPYSLACAEFK